MLTVNYVLPGNRSRFDYSFVFHTMRGICSGCVGCAVVQGWLGSCFELCIIRTVKHSRTVLVAGEDFHRHMEPGAFWQETGISKTCYGFKNQRKTHFS